MQVNYDFYEDLTPDKVDALLEKLRVGNREQRIGNRE
jgi:NADH:ubiquinone oxidoreductase subunit E